MKVGWLIPGFPSDLHTAYWREAIAVGQTGIEVDIVSTRLGDPRLRSHPWVPEGMKLTTFLQPPTLRALLGAVLEFLRAGPVGWARCVAAVARAEGYTRLGRLRLLPFAFLGAQLAWLARRRGWSHVHIHKCTDPANVGLFGWLLSRLSYSLSLHNTLADDGPNQKQKWHHARFATVVSRDLLREVREKLNGNLPPVVEVARMGIDLETFCRRTPYEAWDGKGPAIIFACGRLNPVKRYDILIRALAMVRSRGVDARLRIAGEACREREEDHRRSLERLVEELSLGDAVTFLGWMSEDLVRGELEAAHLSALSSSTEGVPKTLMEAMAMRVPVVATRVGGVPELIDDGVDGLLVEPGDPSRLAEAILKVVLDPALARRLSDASRRKIEAGFHYGVNAQIIARCLRAAGAPNSSRAKQADS